jgi:hypothetical protein
MPTPELSEGRNLLCLAPIPSKFRVRPHEIMHPANLWEDEDPSSAPQTGAAII